MLEQAFWGRCMMERVAAFSIYNRGSRIRKLVHELKYRGRKEAGEMLGEMYGHILHESGFTEGIDLMVPVPLHPVRERRRGYNQSMCIARGLSLTTGLPVRVDLLRRITSSGTQTRRGRYERWENVEGLFAVKEGMCLDGMHVLIVDDVITTGSTIEACVTALKKAGEVKVSAVALAASQKLTL